VQSLTILFDISFLIALIVVFVAGLIRGFAGVGSGMLMAPIFILLFGPVETVAMIIIIEIVTTAQLMPNVYRQIQWPVVGLMGVSALVFMPLGTWLLTTLDAETLSRSVAAIVLLFAVILMTGWRYKGTKRTSTTVAIGCLSGTMMAATSLGNPPVMLYLLSGKDAASTNRANFTGYFAITLTALILWMGSRGLITQTPLLRAGLLLPAFLITAYIGSRLFRQSSELMYRRVTLSLLIGVGIYGLMR
jgi:uncharacterized membrane protein YfcA